MPSFRASTVLVLLGLTALLVLSRLHTINEPIERDLASHAVIAHEVLEGRQLYTDLWDSKPPGIYVAYGLAELVAGFGIGQIFLLNLVFGIGTMLPLFVAGRAVGGRWGGLWAAAFWCFTSGDLGTFGNHPNIEVFINFFVALAFARLVRPGSLGLRDAAWVGAAFAVATLFKQVAVFPAFFLGMAHWLIPPTGESRKKAGRELAVLIATAAGIWVLVCAWFLATGRLSLFVDTLVTYALFYSDTGTTGWEGLWKSLTYWRPFRFLWPLFPAAGILFLFGFRRSPRRPQALLLAYLAGVFIAILSPRQFFAHYYQLWVPPLVIAGGWLAATVGTGIGRPRWGHLAPAALAVAILAYQIPHYTLSPNRWSYEKTGGPQFGGGQFVIAKDVGLELGKMLRPQETFYAWGLNPELYFYAKRKPPAGILWSRDNFEGPLAEEFTERTLADLRREMPELVVVNAVEIGWWWVDQGEGVFPVDLTQIFNKAGYSTRNMPPPKGSRVLDWIWENYRVLPERPRRVYFVLMARKGGRFDTAPAESPGAGG